MKFSEFVSYNNTFTPINKISNMGIVSFGKGITDKNESREPHYIMNECIKLFENVSIVASSINQLVSFIFPNKEIRITSKDEKSVKFLEKWHAQRPNILPELMKNLTTNIITGYAPLERHYAKTTDGKSVLDNVFSMNNTTSLYINPDDIDGDEAYVFEVPIGTKQFSYMGVDQTPQFHMVKYIKNYAFTFRRVYGILLPKWKIAVYNSGWSRDNIYGRSQLASSVDAGNIFQEIMSSWDTIAKTRQIDQKIITLDTNADSMLELDDETIEEVQKKLENSDKSYTILGLPLKFLQTDISTAQGFNTLEGVFELVRKQIMMSLLPQHLTPWSDSATTQGSESAMPPFMARIKAKQNEFRHFLDMAIIDELRKTYPFIAEDATYEFDEPRIMDDSYYITKVSNLITAGILTAEQGRDYMIGIGILDETLFEAEEKEKSPIMLPEQPSSTMKEALTAEEVSFNTFKVVVNTRYADKPFDMTGWKQVRHNNIGGRDIRLIKAEDIYFIFDGSKLIDTFFENTIDDKEAKKLFDEYIEVVKKSFDEVSEEPNEEDKIWDDLQTEIEEEYKKNLDKFFDSINKSTKKKEGFLSDTIFKKFNDIFSGFNDFINKAVDKVMTRLDVVIKKDDEDEVKPDMKTKSMLTSKRQLMADNIKSQLKSTKDKDLANIKTVLSRGIAAGQDVKDIKSEIEKSFNYEDGVRYKIDRIIATDGRTATKILKCKKYLSMGFSKVQWITRNDSKVRDKHKAMNGKVYDIKQVLEWLTQNTLPGTIFNCRCSIVPYM